eukprot:COSAG05_NODE_22338_length_265_cov_0.933735_1_plen_55_part_01
MLSQLGVERAFPRELRLVPSEPEELESAAKAAYYSQIQNYISHSQPQQQNGNSVP